MENDDSTRQTNRYWQIYHMNQYNLATMDSHWNRKAPPGNIMIPSTVRIKTEKTYETCVWTSVTGRNIHIIIILQKEGMRVWTVFSGLKIGTL
jgi:hypothetical protein